jgi:hypothetical protein
VLRQYTCLGLLFREKEGWYEVERELAEMLRDETQPPIGNTPPDLVPKAFDIKTHEEAVEMEEAEEKAKVERAKAVSPRRVTTPKGVLTTAALEAAKAENQDGPEIEVEEPETPAPKAPKARGSRRGKRTVKS